MPAVLLFHYNIIPGFIVRVEKVRIYAFLFAYEAIKFSQDGTQNVFSD